METPSSQKMRVHVMRRRRLARCCIFDALLAYEDVLGVDGRR
jgi:hypothetical protein